MLFRLSTLAATAGLLAFANALSAADIATDLPVDSLLSSAADHLKKGEASEALVYYDAALAKDPTNYLTYFKRATTYLSLTRTAQATSDFNKVIDLEPGFDLAHLRLAEIKSHSADWDGARAHYAAARLDAGSPEMLRLDTAHGAVGLAAAAEASGEWEECVNQAGEAIIVATRSPSLRELRTRCRFQQGQLEAAIGDLHHILSMRPGDTEPHVVISAAQFYGLADMDKGLAQIRKCLHSDPDSKVCKKLHKQQKACLKSYSRIQSQLEGGKTTSAGRGLVGTGEEPGLLPTVREQVDELRQAGTIPPQAKAVLADQLVEMTCQAYTEASHKDAGKYCDEALEADPDSFWSHMHRGKTLLKQEDFEAAIRELEKAAEVRPDKRDTKVNPILNKAQVALKRSKTKDYYKVLGVANDADERQIKAAYRKASKQYHPDKAAKQGISKEDAEKKMASINEAYEVISNPELRARFDRGDDPNSQERESPFQGNPFGGGHPFVFQPGGGRGGANFKFNF